jgi:GntR family transcriptional regulator/MocR family aminotransferase
MFEREAEVPPLAITLGFGSKVPLYSQLYDGLRQAILSGRIKPGVRLPSSRTLAEELGVSRRTVLGAYELLLAEGYVKGKTGSGTFVSGELPEDLLEARAEGRRATGGTDADRSPSRRGRMLGSAPAGTSLAGVGPRPFRHGSPALDEFPWALWSRIASKAYKRMPSRLLAYGEPAGYRPLREAIAGHAAATRAVECTAEEVIVTSGSQQAVDLAVRVLSDPDDRAWIEDPSDTGPRAALLGSGARLVPVPVDSEGLNVRAGREARPHARLAYVTPSDQYPLGVTMSLGRRLELLEWASEVGAWILEDDYGGEHRYSGRPLAALRGLDSAGRVVHVGSFSKSLFPALRLGYLIAPPDLADAFTRVRPATDYHSSLLEQVVLAEFIAEGHLARHLRRMRLLYAERQRALLRAAREQLGGLLELRRRDSGLHLVGWLPEGVSGAAASGIALEHGVDALPVSAYAQRSLERDGLILGYAALDERRIREGVGRLSKALSVLAQP